MKNIFKVCVIFMMICPLMLTADSIAIMNFKVNKLDPEAGEEVADLMSALLSAMGEVKIVERTKLKELFSEQELGVLGLSDADTAAKVQKLLGAKFFVTGKLFPVGKNLYLTTNLISTETSIKKTMMVKMPMSDDYAVLAESAAEKLVETYLASSGDMLPKAEVSASEQINKKVGAIAWPSFAIHIEETHISQKIPDPAAQTEFIYILQNCGAKASEYKQKIESNLLKSGVKEVTISVNDIDILIEGEAFSSYAAKRGDLVSCKARVEIKATVAKTGELLAVGRETAAGVDASESLAAKKSLRLCADKLAREFLPRVVSAWKKKK